LSKISGFTVFYKDHLAKPLAEQLRDDIANKLLRRNRGAKVMNLYMTRSTWTPSVLLEVGFVSNPSEFEWLIEPIEQDRFSSTVVDSIVKFFTAK
jgi:N-acetylmuramoyl-L-alanine amidase